MLPSHRPSILLALLLLAAAGAIGGPARAIGILVPTAPNSDPLQLVHHRVTVEINERGATTKVVQEFANSTAAQLEATYLFPMPRGATVDEFALWMNGRREVGKVMERGEARRIYESIVRRARDPGLIEYVDAELFQARIFPIPPHGRQKVELIYTHLVDYEDGLHRYVYPLRTDARATSTLEDFTLSVHLRSKLPIRNLYSPTHQVATRTRGQEGWASFELSAFSLAEDFALYWSVDDDDVGLTVLTHRLGEEPGYFMLLASPRDDFRQKEIIGKRVSFVVDTSGSMAGEKMQATKDALDYCLTRLGEDDLFNIIPFGSYVESFAEKMVAAGTGEVTRARDFVRQIEPLGGTNIEESLTTALRLAGGSRKAPHMIVFLTDGRPTVGETETAKILERVRARNAGEARIFVLGVGADVNTVLLDKLAEGNGGKATYLRGDASLRDAFKAFYDRVSHPVFSDLKLAISGVRTFGLLPQRLPDLFKGGQLVLLGRYRGSGKAAVTLSGNSARGRQSFDYQAQLAENNPDHAFIPRLWAQRQVGMLLAEIREKGESEGLVQEVTQLATRFGIVTPYTSYLVVEPGMAGRDPRISDMSERPARRSGAGAAPQAAPTDDLGFFASEEAEMSSVGGKKESVAKPKADAKARRALRAESGQEAVAAAREINALRDSTLSGTRKVATASAFVLGRTFDFRAGYYVDGRFKPADRTLVIKTYSEAYFAVLRLRPELKDVFKLGEKIKVNVGKGRSLIIDSDGSEKVGDPELRRFLAP